MFRRGKSLLCHAAIAALIVSAAPALADVRTGVDAWSRGDYAAAVAEWQGPAAAGDADAMFNLGQAYRLGRGVTQDVGRAEQLYLGAAQKGHVQAADTYGILLFQDGRREEALPYISDAARRGDPRSQYLLGIAHFNGDLVVKDWVRAYALVSLANASGLPQAPPAVAQMDEIIPLEDRQRAAGLAEQMQAEANAARAAELAAADLGTRPANVPQASPRVPQPIATAAVSPSVAAARTAIAQAQTTTGTESPAAAGASYADNRGVTPRVSGQAAASTLALAPNHSPAAPATVAAAQPASATAARSSGPWRVQLGAFGVRSNAENLWSRLSNRSEIAGRERLLVPAGRVVKLQAGGFASRDAAQAACNSLKRSGQDCLVTRN